MKPSWVTVLSGLMLLIPASVGLFLTGVPTLLCPLPFLTVVPAFLLANMHLELAAVLIAAILFFTWNPGLFQGHCLIPKRTYGLLLIAVILSLMWFIAGWKYQGRTDTHLISAINVVWLTGFGAFLFLRRKFTSSFANNLVLHLLFFAWLGWYAFPYLGELP